MKRLPGKIPATFLVLMLVAATATRAQAPTFTVLHSFTNSPDGAVPLAAMIMDKAGNLYGTTNIGGAFPSPGGTVFKLDSSGNETVLYSFTGGSDGCRPQTPLIMDTAGNLYGTTTACGAYPSLGTMFKLDTSGTVTVLHNFTCSDGASGSGLIMDLAGNLYGTTPGNSGNGCGFGTVFKLDTSGNYTVLHSYSIVDGGAPTAGLIMDLTGNLYGTTTGDGVGFGTVFKVDTLGNNYTVLHSFGGPDGANPQTPLIMHRAGNLYGTTAGGGASFAGTVFKLDTSGNNYMVLHSFSNVGTGAAGSAGPSALIMDQAGNLYGTTGVGGSFLICSPTSTLGCGTAFKLDTSGNYTVLHNFTGGTDGALPEGLVTDITVTAGNLYGTAQGGGASGYGTVFKLTVQTLAPTITSISPTSAIAGGAAFTLTVNGTNFISGSAVSFSGNARATAFVSATQLTAAILASDIASAGTFNVTVTNPGGETSNSVSFTVVTPQQATQAIINAVNTLFSQGVLNGGQDNSLVKQLQQAINLMNAGKNAGAIGNLDSFISEVNDLVSSGVLSPSQAASLVSAAESVIATL